MSKDFSDINPGILAAAATLAVRKYETSLECFIIEESRKKIGPGGRDGFVKAGLHEDWLKKNTLDVFFSSEVARLTGR